MISLSKGTEKKKGETNEKKDFGDFDGYRDSGISAERMWRSKER